MGGKVPCSFHYAVKIASVVNISTRRRKPRVNVILPGLRSLWGTQPPNRASRMGFEGFIASESEIWHRRLVAPMSRISLSNALHYTTRDRNILSQKADKSSEQVQTVGLCRFRFCVGCLLHDTIHRIPLIQRLSLLALLVYTQRQYPYPFHS